MKKFIFFSLFFLCLSFNIKIIPSMAQLQTVTQGFYSLNSLGLSPNTKYFVQNSSFTDRAYILVFDSKPNLLQAIRLKPQSKNFNLILLKDDYTIIIVGDGIVTIS